MHSFSATASNILTCNSAFANTSASVQFSLRRRLLSSTVGLALSGSFAGGAALAQNIEPVASVSLEMRSPQRAANHQRRHERQVLGLNRSAERIERINVRAAQRELSGRRFARVDTMQNLVPLANDLALNSNQAIFSAAGLAGFHDITIDIGGKVQHVSIDSKLTAAELVAAQQVLTSGKQEIKLNSRGVGVGGSFDLNAHTVEILSDALGGSIGSLYISRGVQAVNSLSSLTLTGALVNRGTIDFAGQTQGQTDTISAASITNRGLIASASHGDDLVPAGIALNSSGDFTNSGRIVSSSNVSISAATVNNSGTISAAGDVNISGVAGGSIAVNGAGGTVQASNGNINFNDASYKGNGDVTVYGGDWISRQFNINGGTGTSDVFVGELTGQTNITAECSHLTAATKDLRLGLSLISGDPTYYNTGTATTAGNIIIDSDISTTTADLAIVATGNIIGNGGKITTTSGDLTIIAGANITAPAPGNSSLPGGGGDSSSTITISDNGSVAGKGSKFGGYIDLSGITLTKNASNQAVIGVGTTSGDVLMVAYKGSGSNSGSIVGTRTANQATGATTISAGTGDVTMVAGGAQITAQAIQGNDVTVLATVPTISGGTLTITDGSVTGSYITTGIAPSVTALNLGTITAANNVSLSTAGVTSGTAAAPLNLTAAGFAFNGTGKTSSLFVNSSTSVVLNPTESSTLNGVLSLTAASGNITVADDIEGSGTVNLTATSGSITGSGVIGGTSANLNASGVIGTSTVNPLNVAVNSLTVNSGAAVNISADASSAGTLLLLASSAGTGQDFNLTAAQPLTVGGVLTAVDGTVSLIGTETTTNTINGTTKIAGISVNAPINVGNTTGSIFLQTTGNENIVTLKSVTLVAPSITIDAAGAVGTSQAPLLTNTPSLIVNGNSTNSIFIKDTGTGSFNVQGVGESISISSAANNFNVGELIYSDVVLTNTAAGAVTSINPGIGKSVGDGTGLVSITTVGDINQGLGSISGNAIVLASTAGDVGGNAALAVSTPDLTADAVKGSVDLLVTGDTNLNEGAALNTYRVNVIGSLNLNGTIKATATKTATGTIDLTVSKNMTQSLITTTLDAPIVTLTALAGASVGIGVDFQSIQTRATSALNINGAANSSSFITQSGAITLGNAGSGAANSNLDLTVLGKLNIAGIVNFTKVVLTDPTSVTVDATGQIKTANLTITSPVLVVNNTSSAPGSGSINIAAGGSASFESDTSLSITGPGVINLGKGLNLSGQNSITLGNTKTPAGGNNPLAGIGGTGGGAGPLGELTIFTKGTLTGAYSQFATSSAFADGILSITANSLKNTGAPSTGPFRLIGNGTNSNSVSLALTGSQDIVVDNTVVAAGKPPNFEFKVGGTAPGAVSITAGGDLTVNPSGLSITPTTGNSIALFGQNLVVNLPANEFSGTKYNSVSLGSLLDTFTVGANTPTQLKNGIAGTVNAEFITISAPSILIQGQAIQGSQMTFNTSTFELDSASSITGVATAKVPKPSLSINNSAPTGLVIVGTAADPGGTYSGISSVLLQSSVTSINLGQLFTSSSLLGNGVVDSIAISAGTLLTIPTTVSTLNVTSNPTSSIYINAGSLVYNPSAKNPQNYLTLSAPTGSVSLLVGTELTLGKARGNVDIDVTNTGSYTVSASKLLTINESLTTASAKLTGAGITFNEDVTTTGVMQVQAETAPQRAGLGGGFGFVFGKKPGANKVGTNALITTRDSTITAGELIIGQVNTKFKPDFVQVDTPELTVVSGALTLNNTFNGDVTVSQKSSVKPLNALTLINTTGSGASTLTIESIITTNGGIDITNTNGSIVIASGANLRTNAGDIKIVNSDLNGTIDIKQNALLNSSGATKASGITYIGIGPVSLNKLVVGSQPGPNLPVVNNVLGGRVFYTTTAHPTGTITSVGLNILSAEGRNIIFNGNGNDSAITLEGGVNITADTAATTSKSKGAKPFAKVAGAPSLVSVVLSSPGEVQVLSGTDTIGSAINQPSNAAQISAQLSSQISSRMVSLNTGNPGENSSAGSAENRLLSWAASNCEIKTLEEGVQLYAPNTLTVVKTGFGAVRVAPGSVVMIMAFDSGLAVYNLHDTKRDAIAVAVGNSFNTLSPGKSAVFTDKSIDKFEQINPAPGVAYRAVVGKKIGNGVSRYHSEFSTISLLQAYDPLRGLYGSKDSDTRKAVNSVLKTAAVLHQLGGGQYQRMIAPESERLAFLGSSRH